jgi:replicative DNA helicase
MIVDVNNIESFDSLGRGFKIKLIALLLFDKVFLQQIIDIMKKEYFEDEAAQWIVEQIYKYFIEYKSTPPVDVMAVMVKGITVEELQKSVIETLKDAYKHSDTSELQFIKDNAIEFCKNQELVSAVYDSVGLIKGRQYDQMRIRMNNAFKAGSDRNIGHIYKDSLEERMSELARVCVPTPWDVINDITQGGSSGGDLFVIMAPPGIGKCVGPNTKIDIQYEQIGIEVDGILKWYDPWDLSS